MGRTDLARFRKNAPSTVPPVDFPPSVTELVQSIQSHSDIHAAKAIRSLSHASSQRDQVSALKLLGVVLKETCEKNSAKTTDLTSSEGLGDLIERLLSHIIFDIPEATPGLVSTSLRAVLRCKHSCTIFEHHRQAFFDRLENINHTCSFELSSEGTSANVHLHKSLASDINAIAAILSETESKFWIFNYSSRLDGVGHLLSYLTDMHVAMLGKTLPTRCGNSFGTTSSKSTDFSDSEDLFFNVSLAVSACESSMKVAQDLTNFLTLIPDENVKIDGQLRASLSHRIFKTCSRLLKIDSIPRSCSLACAVALVTSQLLLHQSFTSKTQLLATLRSDVLSTIPLYPSFSQLAILRAVLEAPLCKLAIPEILFHSNTFNDDADCPATTVFSILADLISESSDLHFRYLATDTMIGCIRAVAPSELDKQCRDAILRIVYLRWEEQFAGTPTQIREILEALVLVDKRDGDAKSFWLDITADLVNSSWLSKGMYAPLCALVKHVGATEILKLQPNCQSLAMLAAASNSHLTKAAADWLDKFWTVLIEEYGFKLDAFIQSTASPLLDALLHDHNFVLRERVAEHILPLYLKCSNREDVSRRADRILACLASVKFTGAQRVRGTIVVTSVARKQGVELRSLTDEAFACVIRSGLGSSEEDLRSFAFDLVVTTGSQTEPIRQVELDFVLRYMPIALMPGGSPSDRSKFKQSMRRFFERFAVCRQSAVEGSGGWWARQRKLRYGGKRSTELDLTRIALLERLDMFEKRCLEVLISCTYPGSSCLRRTGAFEVMTLMSRTLKTSLKQVILEPSCPKAAIGSFISAMFDDWERPRRAAYDYVSSLPSPLPGVSSLSEAESLQAYACEYLDSPRQNCVDSAALLIRTLFQKHVCRRGIGNETETIGADQNVFISFPKEKQDDVSNKDRHHKSDTHFSEIDYCMEILDSIEQRLDMSKKSFQDACGRGLFHGRFLALRYIFQELPWSESRSAHVQTQERALARRFVDLCDRCLRIALHGVSFQKFNEAVEKQNDGFDDANDSDEARDSIFLNDDTQLESTSCFLSAKEICVTLGVLCNQISVHEISRSQNDLYDFDSTYTFFARIGELFCYVFTNTRHWGVIDGATEGMQLLCERVLSSPCILLRRLPSTWVSNILSEALGGKLYVLRRSAGIPWLIAAAVNAEAAINRKSHESPLLNSVMSALLGHLERPNVECMLNGKHNAGEAGDKSQEKTIESISHVLNFLRSLFLNSNIAGNMLQYTEKAFMYCINSFHSEYWLIRNSSMMLYSALIRRGIGVCRERRGYEIGSSFKAAGGTSGTLDGERRMTSTTTFQFFSRHPRLIPFLLSHLQHAVQSPGCTLASSHGSMYPTLYLLSCLSPDAIKDPSLCVSLNAFWPVVRKCSHWCTEFVRRAAAAATVPLIDDYSSVPSIVREILQAGLPSEPLTVSCDSNSSVNEPRENVAVLPLKQNHLHGDLLALVAILQNAQNFMAVKDRVALINVCNELLPSRVWLSVHRLKNKCSVTRASMFELLSLCHDIALNVWRETKCENSAQLLKVCSTVASKIDVDEICFNDPRSEVGAPVLRIKAMKFLAQTLLHQCSTGAVTVEAALNRLTIFLTDQDNETFVAATETMTRILQLLIESKLKVAPTCFDEMNSLLQRMWVSMSVVVQRRENSEGTVAALDLMSCILEARNTHPTCVVPCDDFSIEIIFAAANDVCVDVCERALVVCGQQIENSEPDNMFLQVWMKAVVRACKSETPSLRMAGCTSLFKSGFASGSDANISKKDTELSVQARLIWTSLLEDDSSEVRKHTLKLANKYNSHCGRDELNVHILPCLMKTFTCISIHFSASQVLYDRLTQSLGISDKCNCDDELLSLIAELIRVDSQANDCRNYANTVINNDKLMGNRQNQLFRLESQCGSGETVLHMQLLAWTYSRILYYRHDPPQTAGNSSPNHVEKVVERVRKLGVNELNHLSRMITQVCSKSQQHGSIYLDTLSADGFAQGMRQALRVFLVVQCALVHGMESCVNYIHENLHRIIGDSCEFVHPVLTMAMSGITKVVGLGQLPQQALFLLPPESMTLSRLER